MVLERNPSRSVCWDNPGAHHSVACHGPWANHEVLPFSSMISLMTRYARTNERATSEDDVSFQTVSIVFQVCSLLTSVLLYSCNRALCRCDMDGKRYRSNTLVYGPVWDIVQGSSSHVVLQLITLMQWIYYLEVLEGESASLSPQTCLTSM